ncbi:tripartite tricarboxylate transporter TctB family protein [Brucella endophytica]|uniref:tripartite tricarboxylate transporter TctB family protein n=1 Tax=Brucella endophytica TaxID=1963359 RepID=UPI00166C264D|nr:tripartite tricarboxylate transporter TctB family protein [Brucella endophytica]
MRNKDVLAGLAFLLVAAVFAFGAMKLPMGTTLRMGPGYFPLILSGGLAILGSLILLSGIRNASPENTVGSPAWSRVLIICAAVLVFVSGLQGMGFPLTVFATVFIASTGSRYFRLHISLALAAFIAACAWIIFVKLLGLPFQTVGGWFLFR